MTTTPHRAGYVALIGEPNVGKSTLLNTLLKQKISIVTRKPQTTRHKILGILTAPGYQIVFLDTPGIIRPKYLLQEVMMQCASSALVDADVVLLLVDGERVKGSSFERDDAAVEKIRAAGKKTFLAINKIDKLQKGEILPMIAGFAALYPFDEIFPISGLKGEGLEELVASLVRLLPEHPPYYDAEIVSAAPEKFFVAEIVREKIFDQYSKEIPYSTTVDVVTFEERGKRKHFISAEIFVERQSQKGILIGKGGAALKSLGEKARRDIEGFLGHPVFLELHVKVRENWRGEDVWLRRLGYGIAEQETREKR
ncbi:MAG TPA: GTPase Era [Bacteroidota bacterium]|nr:GTPase Era [Bacteroidota bacterium]